LKVQLLHIPEAAMPVINAQPVALRGATSRDHLGTDVSPNGADGHLPVPRIAVILGSTRPGRRGAAVASWVMEIAATREDANFDLIDLADYPLPHLDEPLPPSMGQYQNAHTQQWAATIGQYDGFIMVTPEYNHSTSGVLKNAIDYLYAEWNNKAVGFVSYGAVGGARAAEHLRLIAGELQMADVRTQVALSMFTDFVNFTDLAPGDYQVQALARLMDEVVAWSTALAPLRRVSA
jgi:NAD(P)H-dependent FMN reductase